MTGKTIALSGSLLPIGRFVEAAGPSSVDGLGLCLIGAEAVREAFEGDLRDLSNLLQGAIKKALELGGEDDWWPYVHGLFDDFIVIEMKDGRLMKYPYQVVGTNVTLDTPNEVVKQFVDAQAMSEENDGDMKEARSGVFLEAETSGARYRICVIKAGLSHNSNFYPEDVLREAVSKFEGCRVYVKGDVEHLAGGGKDFRNMIGALKNATFVEASGDEPAQIQADLILIEPNGEVAVKIREAWNQELTDLFGFSIDARAAAKIRVERGHRIREARKFLQVKSVDLIVEAGAGGSIINLLEAKKEDDLMNREQIVSMLEAAGLLKGKNVDQLSDDELMVMLTEAMTDKTQEEGSDIKEAKKDDDAPITRGELRLMEARQSASSLIEASNLPEAAKKKLAKQYAASTGFTVEDVRESIKDEADYLATFTESGTVQGLGSSVRIVESQFDKIEDMLDAFFDHENKDHRKAQSFKECYITMTGDTRVTGLTQNCDEAVMREALGTGDLSIVLGNAVRRRMVRDYNVQDQYSVWRNVVEVTRSDDFRVQERTRWGGYGDLPVVAESGDYTPLTSPNDEKADFAVSKRGGKESLTLEAIKNDDAGLIRRIPIGLSRSAKRTVAKFALGFFETNPVIYDGVTYFHASHNNLGAAALDKTSWMAARKAMLQQTEMDSGDRLGIPPKYLLVPSDLEDTAHDMFRRNANNDPDFVQTTAPKVLPIWYWSDANDWVATADPYDAPTVEISFLDGQEEPEVFVQDSPTVGSMFNNDTITWKIRHIYGGNVLDFRSAYKAVVA